MNPLSKKADVLVIGELNVDLILNEIKDFPTVGKEITCDSMNLTLGSSSAIFASNLSSLGTKVSYIGKVGMDSFGNLVLASLHSAGVDTSGIIRSALLNTGATIVMNYGEDRAMLTYQGAMTSLGFEDIDFTFFEGSKHLHFSSFFLQQGIQKDLARVFQLAKESGLSTSLDPQWDPAEKWDMPLDLILPWVDIFMPNKQELLNLTSTTSINDAIEKIKGYSHCIAIKDGSQGAWFWNGKELQFQKAFVNIHPVDCIGAGDSFNAGFINKFVKNVGYGKCLEFGAITGALNTTEAGGTKVFEDMEKMKKKAFEQFNYIM